MHRTNNLAIHIANVFATLGYLAAIIEWAWVLLISLYPMLESKPTILFPDSSAGQAIPPIDIPVEFSPLVIFVAVIFTTFVVLTIVWLIVRLPKSVGQKSAEISQKVVQSTIPVITNRKKISAKKRQRLSYKITLAIKAALTILPIIILIFASGNSPLTQEIAWAIGWILVGFTVLYFAIQTLIVRLAQLDTTKVW